jgi:O-acetylserine/cysteine efflux transporter
LASAVLEGPAAWHYAFTHFGWVSLAAVLYQSYPNTIVGYGIWTILMRKYPAATVAPFSLLVPLVGILSAALILDESLQWWKIVAGALVLGGLALNQFGARLLLALQGKPRGDG